MDKINTTKPIAITKDNKQAQIINDAGGNSIGFMEYDLNAIIGHLLTLENRKIVLVDTIANFNSDNLINKLKENNIDYQTLDIINNIDKSLNHDLLTYARKTNQAYAMNFWGGLGMGLGVPPIPTHFSHLDYTLDGGLYPGLYFIGAISSLGKTTYSLQLVEQIAEKSGKDIIVFSLEMSREELIAKSISRKTLINHTDVLKPKTIRDITNPDKYNSYNQDDKDFIDAQFLDYNTYSKKMVTFEGLGDVGIDKIEHCVKEHKRITGNTPIILIDYLQIMKPNDPKSSDKQNIDIAVQKLKIISREYKTPVIAISSLNRGSYKDKISMQAFKESGAIEYSSDVLIGLQLKGAGESDFDVDLAKSADVRDIELVILKNRSGKTGVKLNYRFYAKFNYFHQVDEWWN